MRGTICQSFLELISIV